MSTSLKDIFRIKWINYRVFNTVYGFFRCNESILSSDVDSINTWNVIPEAVINLCLQFYCLGDDEFECWNIVGQHMKILGKNKHKLKKIQDDDGCDSYENTSYGLQTIKSTEKAIYKWILKIYKSKSFWAHIGITSNFECVNDSFAQRSGTYRPRYSLWTPKLLQMKDINSYSLISIELNLYQQTLKFYIDGKVLDWEDAKQYSFYDKSHAKIRVGDKINYKLAYSCYKKGQGLSIVGFQRIYN